MFKIERCKQAPPSLAKERLKASGTYNCPDVIKQLRIDSFNKCYICEVYPSDIEVEHRLPHKNGKYIDRKFDWNNLFLVCPHCNNVKKNEKYDSEIIDCCKEDPDDLIKLVLRNDDVEAINKTNRQDVALMVELINEVFNLTNTGIRIYACEERVKRLQGVMNTFYKELGNYIMTKNPEAYHNVVAMLSRKAEFAGFTRSYILQNRDVFGEFIGCL